MNDTTKAFGDGATVRQFASISKVEEQDDGTIKVFGVASTGSKDSAGETITSDAMKAALPEYERFPAVREMHQLSAAGTTLNAEVDADGMTRVEVHVVDAQAIQKVKLGVYKGFSIGGKALARDPQDRTIITKLKLNEISLVDRPCNPEATIDLWKADASTEGQSMSETPAAAAWAPSNTDVLAKAEALAVEANKPGRRNDFVSKARALLIAAQASDADVAKAAEAAAALEVEAALAAEAEPAAEAVAEVAAEPEPAAEVVEVAPVDKADAETPVAEAAPDPLAALEASIAKASAVTAVADAEQVPGAVTEGLDDFAKGMAELAATETVIAKGLYTVGRLAEVMQSLVSIQASSAYEAKSEGDGSAMPATLAASIKGLGVALIDMAKEEVAELLAEMPEGMELVISDDSFAYAAKAVDIVKADADLLEKAGKRNSAGDQSKLQSIHDNAAKLGATCAACDTTKAETAEDIAKAARLDDALAKATATIDDLTKRLENTPAPAKTVMTPAGLTAITKTADAAGEAQVGAAEDTITKADMVAYVATLTPAQLGDLQVRHALARPMQLGRQP